MVSLGKFNDVKIGDKFILKKKDSYNDNPLDDIEEVEFKEGTIFILANFDKFVYEIKKKFDELQIFRAFNLLNKALNIKVIHNLLFLNATKTIKFLKHLIKNIIIPLIMLPP